MQLLAVVLLSMAGFGCYVAACGLLFPGKLHRKGQR